MQQIDAHEAAPAEIKRFFKFYQKVLDDQIEGDHQVLDLAKELRREHQDVVQVAGFIPRESLSVAAGLLARQADANCATTSPADVKIYEVKNLPGLRLIPSLMSQQSQKDLLSTLLHDNLANQEHKTNVHLHYSFPPDDVLSEELNAEISSEKNFPSFFRLSPRSAAPLFRPLDDVTHKPFTVAQFLHKKLRWMTLGAQFDWTSKNYPLEDEVPFPKDVGNFTTALFPSIKPEAAIVNIYRPGDVLSVHRDVSEECNNSLVSFSLGCEAILIVGLKSLEEKEARMAAIRLRSGDAVCLSGQARFAWHGVPRIVPGTCPKFLRDWPVGDHLDAEGSESYEAWRGWMLNNRVNLSVRQIRD